MPATTAAAVRRIAAAVRLRRRGSDVTPYAYALLALAAFILSFPALLTGRELLVSEAGRGLA